MMGWRDFILDGEGRAKRGRCGVGGGSWTNRLDARLLIAELAPLLTLAISLDDAKVFGKRI